MADNPTIDNGALTDIVVSADDAGAAGQVQRTKLAYSADGVATHVPADADGLLVNLGTNNDVTVAGVATAAKQDAQTALLTTIDADTSNLSVVGSGTEAAAQRVTIATDSTGVLSVDDNGSTLSIDDGGGVITVDGTVGVTGVSTLAEQQTQTTALQLIDDTVFADDAAFTPGTSKVTAIGLLADQAATDSVNEGDIGIPRMTLDRKQITTVSPSADTEGWDVAMMTSGDSSTALTNGAQAIKATAGKLGGYYIYNPNATATYVMIYNVAFGSVTVGTTVARMILCIPATSGANVEFVNGITFDTALSAAAATTGPGNSAPSTALEANFYFK